MVDREKVIKTLEFCVLTDDCRTCEYWIERVDHCCQIMKDALAMLKEQEGYVSVPFSWLVKFCTHIDFVEPLTDADREVAWRQKLKQQFGIDLKEGGEVEQMEQK